MDFCRPISFMVDTNIDNIIIGQPLLQTHILLMSMDHNVIIEFEISHPTL